jgi:ADP-ribose pyrophosphatase YjhB (NUDIX family)
MQPIDLFEYCPRCAQPRHPGSSRQPFHCDACSFHYYFNPCVAVAAIVLDPDDRALFIRRANEPAKGRLAVPGGFLDLGETAEIALRREIKEEVNLEVGPLDFLCTALNAYDYRGVTYPVLDLAFVARANSINDIAALDGVESYCWHKPFDVDPEDIAFPSIRAALAHFRQRCAVGPSSR